MPLYSMYRDLALTAEDRTYLNEQNLRFDTTVIPPGSTSGRKGTTTRRAPQASFCQVLAGEALYLLQRRDLHGIAVAAKAGEFVLIPRGYDHQPR